MAILRSYSATLEQNAFAQAAVTRYRFNEGSGSSDALDSIGDLDGTYQAGAAPGAAGGIGDGAATFNGSTGVVLVEPLSGTITVSAFGDSLIGGDGFQAADQQFSPELDRALEARGLTATVNDRGVNGDTSEEGFARIQDVIDDNPDVVILEFGTNDAIQDRPIADVEQSLRDIITQLRAEDIQVLVTGTFGWYPERNGGAGYDTAQERDGFEALFADIVSNFDDPGVVLLQDTAGSDKFLGGERDPGDPDNLNDDTIVGGVLEWGDPNNLNSDGLHPNSAGIDVIVPRVAPQIIALTQPLQLANGSVELWFTPDVIGGAQMLLSKNGGDNTAGDIEILLDGNTVRAAIQNGTDTFPVFGGSVAEGENVHVVLTFGDGGLQLFVDGLPVASEAGFTGGLVGNIEELALGARVDGEAAFDGVIDEVAIYDRALTVGEIGQLFGAGQQGGPLIGTAAAETLIGGSDDEDLRGAGGDDVINGNDGDDRLRGGGGADTVRGGQGNDALFGGGGADQLLGDADNDTLRGFSGHDRIVGGGGDDLLQGHSGRDTLSGASGADELFGARGIDVLRGGSGDDVLNGGPGRDLLRGGSGSDTFQIDRVGHGVDRIFEFQDGVAGDVLDLSAVLDYSGGEVDDFVRFDPVNGNTKVAVNANGDGDDFTVVFNLVGATGLEIDTLVNDGNVDLGAPTS